MRRAVSLLPSRTVHRYVVAHGVVYRIQPVNTMALAEHGWASLEGSDALRQLREEQQAETERLAMVAQGISPDEAAELLVKKTELAEQHNRETLELVLSTPQGRRDYEDRRRAYVCAGVCGLGAVRPPSAGGSWDEEAYGPLSLFVGLMPADWFPDAEDMCLSLSDDAQPDGSGPAPYIDPDARVVPSYSVADGESEVDAVQRVHEAGHLVYGADLNEQERQCIFLAVKAVSKGQARRAAPFRLGRRFTQGPHRADDQSPREVGPRSPGAVA